MLSFANLVLIRTRAKNAQAIVCCVAMGVKFDSSFMCKCDMALFT